MKAFLIALISIVTAGVQTTPTFAQSCYETMVQSPTPFMGNNGEIVKLADGSLWEVRYAYEYLYEYHPIVVICPGNGSLIIDNKTINVRAISTAPAEGNAGLTPIESTIVSKFGGLEAGNIYRLANGQIWEQVEAWIWVWVWVNPTVLIYQAGGGYKMKVENIEHAVLVQRIR